MHVLQAKFSELYTITSMYVEYIGLRRSIDAQLECSSVDVLTIRWQHRLWLGGLGIGPPPPPKRRWLLLGWSEFVSVVRSPGSDRLSAVMKFTRPSKL